MPDKFPQQMKRRALGLELLALGITCIPSESFPIVSEKRLQK